MQKLRGGICFGKGGGKLIHLLAGEVTWCVGNIGRLLSTCGGGNVEVLTRLLPVSQRNEECHQLERHCDAGGRCRRHEILFWKTEKGHESRNGKENQAARPVLLRLVVPN